MVQKMAADWMEDNPWYDPRGGNEESQIAQIVDKKLTDEGFDPTSEDYWDELSDRLSKYLPKQSPSTQRQPARPRSVMTSSGRDTTATTKSNEFRISPDRVAAMKEAGAWENPELRRKMTQRFIDYDRANKNRG